MSGRKNIVKMLKTALCVVLGVTMMLSFGGCFAKKYNVDYCGAKFLFENAKDSYRAGKKVTIYYVYVATDTDYRFYLDGESIKDIECSDQKGFKISFIMPEHDVTLEVDSRESMLPME